MVWLKTAEAIEEIRAGRMVILMDDEDRENEGDLCIAAEKITPEIINFMIRHARGLVCLTLTEEKADSLDLMPMVKHNTSPFETGFTVSIEARDGVTTGISAADRAKTILTAVAKEAKPGDLVRPGHIFPLRGRKGGVMVRTGQTEGSIDLARLAGLSPSGVICEIINEDGTMSRRNELEKFSDEHGIGLCTIADLVEYRLRTESFVNRVAEAGIPTMLGTFKCIVYENDVDDYQHVAMVKGDIDPEKPTLVRVHSECLTGDIFGSMKCDCGSQLHEAMRMIEKDGSGVLLYIRQEGRGIGLVNKIKAYALQEKGMDTVEANEALGFLPDLRNYGVGAQILLDLGIRKMRLITNNPVKMAGLGGYGLDIVERVPIEIEPNQHNESYLLCKQIKMGHTLHITNEQAAAQGSCHIKTGEKNA